MEKNSLNLQTPDQIRKKKAKFIILICLAVAILSFTVYYFANSEGGFFQGKMEKIDPQTKLKEKENKTEAKSKAAAEAKAKAEAETKAEAKAKAEAETKAKAKAEAEFRAMLEKQKAETAAAASEADNDDDSADDDTEEPVSDEAPADDDTEEPVSDEAPAAQTYGTLTIEKNGSIASPKVDDDDFTIARFRISPSDSDAEITSISLLLTGSVNVADVQDFKLYQTGYADPISQVATVDMNDRIVFPLSNNRNYREIRRDAIRSFYVTADLNTGRSSDEIKIYIDQDSDITAVGKLYNLPFAIDKNNYDGGSCASNNVSYERDCSYSNID